MSELQFDKFRHLQHSYVGRLDSKTKWLVLIFHRKQCYGWKKWRWLIHWKNWSPRDPVSGKNFPNFEMLDAKIASALNKIIQNSQFKKKVSLEEQKAQKKDRFLRGRQIALTIYDYFRVTGVHDAVLHYEDLFSVTLRDGNVQEFHTSWDEVLLSMSKIPSDNFLEGLHRLRIRGVWSTQNRIGIVRHGNSSEDIDA